MLTIVQRSGATREKPPEISRGQAARLPWAWDSLCFAVPFHQSNQYGLTDIVNNVPPSVQSGVVWTEDDRGNPTVSLGTASYLEYPDHPQHDRPSTEITVYARVRRTGTPEPYGGMICNVYGGYPPYLSWGIQQYADAANSLGGWLTVGGLNQSFAVADVMSTTEHVSAFMRWRTGSLAQFTVLGERSDIIADVTSDISPSGTISYNAGAPLRINTTESVGDNEYSGLYSQCMVWARHLTSTELLALVADPFGWYSPRRSTVITSSPYGLPFGGGEMHGMSGGMGGLY